MARWGEGEGGGEGGGGEGEGGGPGVRGEVWWEKTLFFDIWEKWGRHIWEKGLLDFFSSCSFLGE